MEIVKRFSSICKNRNTLLLKMNDIIYGNISYTNINNAIVISNLYVHPSYRNHNYGTKLLYEAEKTAISNNITKYSQLHTRKIFDCKLCAWDPIDNPHLISFYKKRGYIIDPIEYTQYYDDGDRIFELVKMSKKIVIFMPLKN